MRKIFDFLVLFFSLLFVQQIAYSATPVDFIYINGSNTNSEKAYNSFIKGTGEFHPVLKKQIEKDEFMRKHFLNDGEYFIEEKPSHYFWGYKSQEDLFSMQHKAYLLKGASPIIAYAIRNTFSDMLHDAIWVKNSYNMIPIIEELDLKVKDDIKQGKKVVLLGYSAGSFITFEYIITKEPYINLVEWFSDQKIDKDLLVFMKKHPQKDTCPSALMHSKLVHLTAMGVIVPNNNKAEFKSAYLNTNKNTAEYCVPPGNVIGIINYASPIPLFYSDMANSKFDFNKFAKMMYRYLISQDFFFLTVNFADDFLGFPNDVNYKNSYLEKEFNFKFKEQNGFFYDYSKVPSYRTFALAHLIYWKAKKRFSKAIIQGYTEGYNFQYGKDANNESK